MGEGRRARESERKNALSFSPKSMLILSSTTKRKKTMPPPSEGDEFAALSRALAALRDRDTAAILTDEFLEVCRGVLPVIGD